MIGLLIHQRHFNALEEVIIHFTTELPQLDLFCLGPQVLLPSPTEGCNIVQMADGNALRCI